MLEMITNASRDSQSLAIKTPLPGIGISAVIITYNEERIIAKTLKQLYWCDEIIIVDSYSNDNTVNICKQFGCKVVSRQFEGYGLQKKYAVSLAKNDWIICIDADEVLTNELIHEILHVDWVSTPYVAYSFPMNMFFLNKEFRYGHESGRYFIRMFNRKSGGFLESKVHEGISVEGPIKKMNGMVLHYSYYSLRQYLDKFNKYSTLSAEMAYKTGKNKSMPVALLALPFNFFKYYLLERNFLNGSKGLVWSILSTCYHFVKFVKLKELQQSPHSAHK
jgi:glycosyltransferase involved in cell wall biosynthesis